VIVVIRFVSMPLVIASVVLSDIARIDFPSRVVFSIMWTATISTTAIAITISWFLVSSNGPMCRAAEIGMLKKRTWAPQIEYSTLSRISERPKVTMST